MKNRKILAAEAEPSPPEEEEEESYDEYSARKRAEKDQKKADSVRTKSR
jgi:hypothetical protein